MRLLDRIFKRKPPGKLDKLSAALLKLNFLSGSLDKRITFSRTTNATVTGSNGLIQNAPHNLLTYSEQFDNAAWVKGLTTVAANATVAPDGSSTADALIETATTGAHQFYRLPGLGVATYTYTVYAKANGRTQFVVQQESGGDSRFTLSGSGTALALGTNTVSIIALANGWYRCSTTFTVTGAFGIYTTLYNGATTSYTGDGTSGIYLWGAQLELGSTATTYNPTTVKNLLGYTEHFDNAAWTKSNSFVQTNLLLQSDGFSGALITPATGIVVVSTGLADPQGNATARQVRNTTTTEQHRLYSATTSSGRSTFSVQVKNVDAGFVQLSMSGVVVPACGATFNLTAKTYTLVGSTFPTAEIIDIGNGYLRLVVTAPASETQINNVQLYILEADNGSANPVTTGTGKSVIIAGAQLVQGTSAGDYKATYAAAAAVGYTDIYGQPFAQKLVPTTTSAAHKLIQSLSTAFPSGFTFSVYVKAAGYNFVALNEQAQTGLASSIIDLRDGSGATGSTTVTAVGDGWWRIGWSPTASFGSPVFLSIVPLPVAGVSPNNYAWTGDGTSGIYIFGAQLSDSASVDPYVYNPVAAPSSTAYYGPRFDYDASGATFTEQLGTELVTNGDFSNGTTSWAASAGTIAAVSGEMVVTNSGISYGTGYQTLTTVAGKTYKVTLNAYAGTATTVYAAAKNALLTNPDLAAVNTSSKTSTALTFVFTATGASTLIVCVNSNQGNATGYFDNISVKEYLGTTSTGAVPKGLLIEEQRTNLLTYSEQFDNVAWAKSSATVTPNMAVSPDGTVNADLVVSSTYVRQSVTIPASAARYTVSVYAKAAASNSFSITEAGATASSVSFNLSTGTFVITDTGGSPSATITSVGNGWYRCSFSYTSNGVQTTLFMNLNPANSYLWGAQLEAGAFATSYIPTVASQVTRAADSASMIGNNFARWFNQSAGTLSAQFDVSATTAASGMAIVSADNGAANGYLLYKSTVSASMAAYAGTNNASIGSVSSNISAKGVVAYDGTSNAGALNGASPVAISPVAVPAPTQLFIGKSFGGNQLSGHLQRIAYYPRRLSNTELQGITS